MIYPIQFDLNRTNLFNRLQIDTTLQTKIQFHLKSHHSKNQDRLFSKKKCYFITITQDQCDSQGCPVDIIICTFLGSGRSNSKQCLPQYSIILNLLGYLGMQLSKRQWLIFNKSWISCLLYLSPSLTIYSQSFRHSYPSPPLPTKLCKATLQDLLRLIGQSWIFIVQRMILSPGFLEASQVKLIPEKAKYLPDRLGYMLTDISKAQISILAGTILTITVSRIIFSITPKVIGPALMQISALKPPLFIIAISAPLSCLYKDTRNQRQGLCSFLIVLNLRSRSFLVKQATVYCLALNYLQMYSIYKSNSGSGSKLRRLWLTYISQIQKIHFQVFIIAEFYQKAASV